MRTTVIYRNGDARALKPGGFESRFHMRVESEAELAWEWCLPKPGS